MTAFITLEFAEEDIKRFIEDTPQKEDDIKQYLKMTTSGNNKAVKNYRRRSQPYPWCQQMQLDSQWSLSVHSAAGSKPVNP